MSATPPSGGKEGLLSAMSMAEGQQPAGIQPPDVTPEEPSATSHPSHIENSLPSTTTGLLTDTRMLPSQTENQSQTGDQAKEADPLQRSKKKTKRGLAERDGEPMEMEEDGLTKSVSDAMKNNEGHSNKPDIQPENAEYAEEGESPVNPEDPTVETSQGPTWKVGDERAQNQGVSRPLGDKYGSWMIANRKPRNYQNKVDPRRSNGKNMEGKNTNTKGKPGWNQEGHNINFNKEGFKIWENSRFGALENLEEEIEVEIQEEHEMMEGPTGKTLAGKGKRPQVQITEAQILNDKAKTNTGNDKGKQKVYRAKEGNRRKDNNKKQGNQAAETENHTVVRGFDKGNRVERTMITEEGSRTEVFTFQAGGGDHHQDPPDGERTTEEGTTGDPMTDVEFAEGQCSSSLRGVEQ
nr:uncharacterized protein LOC109158743 [Ipomoea batatas]GME19424.1 uncharacterized protein LOC109158743 [Ipomoea batatas]